MCTFETGNQRYMQGLATVKLVLACENIPCLSQGSWTAFCNGHLSVVHRSYLKLWKSVHELLACKDTVDRVMQAITRNVVLICLILISISCMYANGGI